MEGALWFGLLIVPVVIGLAWGVYLDDSAYVTFRYARHLASGRGLTNSLGDGDRTLLRSPLYVLVLALLDRLGMLLPEVGLILSALGWGVATVAIYVVGKAMQRPVAAAVSATLLVSSPIVVSTLGTGISWAVAWAWIAIASSVKGRWTTQACALALMLGVYFDPSTLALATSLLAVQWIERHRFPLWSTLALAIAALGWGLTAARQGFVLFHLPRPGLAEWERPIRQLLGESEFYWLFLPFMGLGLLAATQRALWAGFLWGAISTLSEGGAARAPLAALGLFLAGLGIDWAIGWLQVRDVFRLDRPRLAVSLALVAGLPLGIAQASSLLDRYQFRPVVRQALEGKAADWLRVHSEPAAVILGSERVGYLADRPTLVWDGTNASDEDRALLLKALSEDPPEYCVSFRSLAWDLLLHADLFQDGYEPLQAFESPYDSTSPFVIWGYRLRAFDVGEHRPVPLNVRLPGQVDLVGYQYWPDRIQPGGAVSVTLFLRATQPIADPYHAIVRMISPGDGRGWAQDTVIPRDVLADGGRTGQVIAGRLVLTTTADVPIGAYRLEVSAVAPDLQSVLPIYRRQVTVELDRISLGHVVVPWQGKLDAAQPVGANLGNQISLVGFEAPDRLSAGARFDVTLYWEALRPPEGDYVVFVHLLDADGRPVASHDGPPVDGRYPTTTWLPGEVVPDVHRMVLGPDVPAGTHRLRAGMYQWPSMERLPVWDGEGVEQADRVAVLRSVKVE